MNVSGFAHLMTKCDGVTAQLLKLAEQQIQKRKAGDLCVDLLLLFAVELALHTENYCCQCRELEGCNCMSVRCFSAAISSNRKIKMPVLPV